MQEKHLKRTNKTLGLIHLIATIFATIGLLSQLQMSGMEPIRSIIPLALNIIVLVCGVFVSIKTNWNYIYTRYVAIGYSVVYLFMLLTAQSGTTFPYMIPFIIAFVLSLDGISLTVTSITFVASNVIRVIITLTGASSVTLVIEECMIELIITILVCFSANKGSKLLKLFFSESMNEVLANAEKNKAVSDKIIVVASDVKESAGLISDTLEQLNMSTQAVYEAMDNISQGSSAVAEAITNQTCQTQEIHEILSDTNDRTEDIVKITEDAMSALKKGTEAMESLFNHVNKSIESSKIMSDMSDSLQKKSDQVRGITDIIMGISSQTNLLALNASIEAARAGEMGKGFAVVAEEIRNLAEQTRKETENITSLLDALATDANQLSVKVEENVEVSNQENLYAKDASERFEEITNKINELSTHIEKVSKQMQSLVVSNNTIVDNVSTLSASSEEISASTQEACNTSERNVGLIKDFSNSMEKILQEINELKQYT